MQKTKAKRDILPSRRRLPFVVMSVVIAIISMLIEAAFAGTNPLTYLTFQQVQIAVFSLRLIPVLLQVVLIERFLKQSMRGWLVYTAIGTLITLILLSRTSGYPQQIEMIILVGFLTVFGPMTILQTIWLSRRYNRAVLWPIFILLSAYIAPKFLRDMSASGVMYNTIFPLIAAAVQAFVFYSLLSHPRDTEKAKIDHATDHDASQQHDHLERLQDREREQRNPLWNTGDEQALQSEA